MHSPGSMSREYLACRFRRQLPQWDERDAVCGLLQELTGLSDDDCRVQADVCTACCRSAWTSGERFGPVVASLVYDVVSRIQSEGRSALSPARVAQLKEAALARLEVVPHEPDRRIWPARATESCCHLGEIVSATGGIPVHRCHHPAHTETTAAACHRCRDWARSPTVDRAPLPALVPLPKRQVGPSVKKWAVGVTTAPRREPTLEICVQSLLRAGFERPHLFVDAAAELPPSLWPLTKTWRSERTGAWPNFYLGLSELVQAQPQADAYLMLQDDAYCYDGGNLREYLEQALWPGDERCLVSLFSTDANVRIAAGWNCDPYPWWCGAQAWIFPAAIARALLIDERIHSYRWTDSRGGTTRIDPLIGGWAAAEQIRVWYPVPSLVQHVGNTSTLWNGTGNWAARHAPYFAGDLEEAFSNDSTLADFPEADFPAVADCHAEFLRRVYLGQTVMRRQRAVICGLCRDVRPWLPRSAARIERLGSMFQEYRIVLYENDSRDGTDAWLDGWRGRNDRVHVISELLGIPPFAQNRELARAEHMARCRNRYRDWLLERYPGYEIVIVVDMDLRGGWSYDGIANTFGNADWDFCGSNGVRRWLRPSLPPVTETIQYDTWALRYVGHSGVHDPAEIRGVIYYRGEPLVPVWSCFGGLGIYRMECFQAARYQGDDLEHASLHAQMRAAGFDRLFLNPSQVTLY